MILHYSTPQTTTPRFRVDFTIPEAQALRALLSESEGWTETERDALLRVEREWNACEADAVLAEDGVEREVVR